MQRRVMAVLLGVSFLMVALNGYASGQTSSKTDGSSAGAGPPSYHFDWDEVAAADAAPVATLSAGPSGTCRGHVTTSIGLGPKEAGIKSLTLAPVPGEPCVFQVHATLREGGDAQRYAMQVDAAMHASGCCVHDAEMRGDDGSATVSTEPAGTSNAEDFETGWCRFADGWAHTGVPDPPTVVYTRVYQEMEFCYDDSSASIEQLNGLCFANSATEWHTDPNECYFSDWELGPAGTVFLSVHGYFEKHVNYPFYPYHDLWNTVHGDAGTGKVYCTGEIAGDYDGYATTNNCGASAPEPQLV